jgi:hypothetical protein
MTGMLVFVDPGSPTQVIVAILNCIVSIVMYSHLRPFEKDSDDNLAIISNWSIFFTLFGALIVRLDVDDVESYNDHNILGYLLIFINCAGLFLVALQMSSKPVHYILRRLKSTHRHKCEIRGLTEDQLYSPKKFWEYSENLLHSNMDEAGWLLTQPDLNDDDFKDWVELVEVQVEWRCSSGNGPIDQIRASFVLSVNIREVKEYLLNEHCHMRHGEAERSILSSYPEKSLKRYYTCRKLMFPFNDRDFMMEEWSGSCKREGKERSWMAVARSYRDERRKDEKSSANLRRTRGKLELYAFLLEPVGRGYMSTKVTFIGGGFDLNGWLFTDLIGRSAYIHLMTSVVDELDLKFNEDEER